MVAPVAMFGFGAMGIAITRRLLTQGYPVNVWNRTSDKLAEMVEAGAIAQACAAGNIKSANIILSALPDALALQEVLFNDEWAHELQGRHVIHFGSLNPSRSQAFMDAFQAHQANYIEVAAQGGVDDIANGSGQLLVGSDEQDFNKVQSLLSGLSSDVRYVGEVGTAAAIKLAFQQMSAAMFCTFSSAIGLVKDSGIEVELFMELLRESSTYTPMFDKKLFRLINRDYSQPTIPGKTMERDLKLFLEEADQLGFTSHHVESIMELVSFSLARGMRDMDFTSVYDIINPPKE